MKNLTLLSHEFDSDTPGYGGSVGFQRTPSNRIADGKSSNSEEWSLKNHSGTHIDFPRHFFNQGAALSAYQPRQFLFAKTELADLPLRESQIVEPLDLERIPVSDDCEFLILRTGFELHRMGESYWKNNPGLHPDCAAHLRSRFPRLRAVGFDFISLTAFQHRELGREAHRQFLNPQNPIWIVEDMKLAHCKMNRFSSLISPFLVKDADGTPVSVFAFESEE